MPAAVLTALLAAAVVLLVVAPLRWGLVVLLGVTLLVPDSLVVPYEISDLLNVQRLCLVAFVARLAIGLRRGDVDLDALRVTPVHVALLGFAAASFVVGVMLAPSVLGPTRPFDEWLLVVDQVLFFTVVLAAIRTVDDMRWVARVVVVLVAVSAAIAVGEHVARTSYTARVFFADLPAQADAPGARPIELRGGDVRVRGATGFALAYAWIVTALLPLVTVVSAWARRRVWLALPPLVLVAILWTYSRSALVGVAAGAVALVVAARGEGRTTRVVAVGALAVVVVLGAGSLFDRTFDARAATGSDAVREERLPVVLEAAADRPLLGAGLTGVTALGFAGTDSSYVKLYVETGVIGLVAFGLLGVTTLTVAAGALRAPPGVDRALGAAILTGMVVSLGGALAFDLFPTTQSSRPFWLLAALGVGIGEWFGTSTALPRFTAPRRLLVAGVALAGVVVLVLAPRVDVATYRFQALGVGSDARADVARDFVARVRVRTACAALEATADALVDVDVTCGGVPGGLDLGQVRIAVPAGAGFEPAAGALWEALGQVVADPRPLLVDVTAAARPAWAITAPLWAAGLAAGAALAWPSSRPGARRRRGAGAAGPLPPSRSAGAQAAAP